MIFLFWLLKLFSKNCINIEHVFRTIFLVLGQEGFFEFIQTDFNFIKSDFNRKVNCNGNFQVGWPWKQSLGFLPRASYLPADNSECQTSCLDFNLMMIGGVGKVFRD